MLVLRENLSECLGEILEHTELGLDTETTGLEWHDRLFSIIFATAKNTYYFSFQDYGGGAALSRDVIPQLQAIFRPGVQFYASNVKFDMLMLMKEGLIMHGEYFCTAAQGRIFQNNLIGKSAYSLAAWAERLGEQKSTAVEEHILHHGLFESVEIPGKEKKITRKFFHMVPLHIVQPYAEHDARLHLKVGKYIRESIEKMPNPSHAMPVNIMRNELRLTKVCADMEWEGVKIDKDYVQASLRVEQSAVEKFISEFKILSGGYTFVDSSKALGEVFEACGYQNVPRTDKGNPSFTDENLDFLGGPMADCVKQIRFHEKRISTYYSSFLYYAGEDGVIHPGMRQGGTQTGRFSYSEPNLQNVPKEEDKDSSTRTIVRKSFIPRGPDFCFVSIDYDQQEYRMMLDYAGEHTLIRQVLEGADVHQAIADLLRIPRAQAKTLNFSCLYGSGPENIASVLKITIPEAQNLLEVFFRGLPKVKGFIEQVRAKGRLRGYVVNWAGRRCHIDNPNWAYKLPNHLIQGGCADVIKFAMPEIHELLHPTRSRMKLQIHDELLIEMHCDDFHLIPAIQRIMESTYKPFNKMRLTTSVEHSWKSWGAEDKIKGAPNGNTFTINSSADRKLHNANQSQGRELHRHPGGTA